MRARRENKPKSDAIEATDDRVIVDAQVDDSDELQLDSTSVIRASVANLCNSESENSEDELPDPTIAQIENFREVMDGKTDCSTYK